MMMAALLGTCWCLLWASALHTNTQDRAAGGTGGLCCLGVTVGSCDLQNATGKVLNAVLGALW
jgi:hypothetical protein